MGEYVNWGGRILKLGTLEDLFFVRYDELLAAIHAGEVERELGNLEPAEYLAGPFRFRFPFPDEDGQGMGRIPEEFDRGVLVPWPTGMMGGEEHSETYGTIPAAGLHDGWRVTVKVRCPQDPKAEAGRYSGPRGRWLQIVQQRPVDGMLWGVVRCPWCGALWRLTRAEAEALAGAIEAGQNGPELLEVARRLLAGYARDVAAELAGLPRAEEGRNNAEL